MQDYGTLYCRGENAIGRQEEPCAFQIVPTGEPYGLMKSTRVKSAVPLPDLQYVPIRTLAQLCKSGVE